MALFTVFQNDKVIASSNHWYDLPECRDDIYVFNRTYQPLMGIPTNWYNTDGVIIPVHNVPKKTQMLALVLNL
jgi:hypothetical protein